MAGVYRSRHPEQTVLYRVLSHHFDRFLTEHEARFAQVVFDNSFCHVLYLLTMVPREYKGTYAPAVSGAEKPNGHFTTGISG
jgi:hypothetical protein